MKLAILSNGNANYSTKRLVEEAERRGHKVKVVKYKNCYLSLDDKHPDGFIAGARIDYEGTDNETEARGLIELQAGDKIDFICDYYGYDGTYQESFYLGDQMVVPSDGELTVENVSLEALRLKIAYVFTDIYNQERWTESVDR